MAIRLTRPTSARLRQLAEQGREQSLTYAPVGVTAAEETPPGYRRDRWQRTLGHGDADFARAADAIRQWAVHRGAGLVVGADRPPSLDQVVAMSAPLPVGYIDVVCRVVAVVDEPDRFGFTYGTLPAHPQRGEESFIVDRASDGSVTFTITAVSRPAHPLARVASPIARRLQHAATNRYFAAMTAAIA